MRKDNNNIVMAKVESLGRSKPSQPEHAVGETGTGKKQFHGESRRASEPPTKDSIQGVNMTCKEGLEGKRQFQVAARVRRLPSALQGCQSGDNLDKEGDLPC